jgi:hypothetical protein
LRTIFLAHAEPDHEFACRLAEFLEFGCDVTCYSDEGVVLPGEDFIAKAADGLTGDILALLLSEASCPNRWPRERWEHILFEETQRMGVQLVAVLLGDCPYPALLRRRNFIDATSNRLAAMRLMKRWIWQRERGPEHKLALDCSTDLEEIYRSLADKAGILETTGAVASRFAREASLEFEAVLWVPCHLRSAAQIAGELGAQLGLILEGVADENCRTIQAFLSQRRCLLVLDSPPPGLVDGLAPRGRTSTLVTCEPVSIAETPESLEYARSLVSSRRYAEAYELLYRLLHSGVATEFCARELTWICEHWDRIEEANSLRWYYGPQPSEQLTLF